MKNILDTKIQKFIRENIHSDIPDLLLKQKKYPDFNMREVAEQIQCLKKAQKKLPTWFAKENLIYSNLSLEQCSSEITAQFKAQILIGDTLADLTGGFGVDTYFFAQKFTKVWHIEPNLNLQDIVKHNFSVLDLKNVIFCHQKADEFLKEMPKVDAIFLDPSRRDAAKQKVFLLEDCEPNVLHILTDLFEKTNQILLKLSPMLDLHLAIRQLKYVQEVYVVALENEVKELLFVLKNEIQTNPKIHAVDLYEKKKKLCFDFSLQDEHSTHIEFTLPAKYLIEPSAAMLKAGAFKSFAKQYNLKKLHIHSHLYTCDDSPSMEIQGRIFEITALCKYDKKAIQNHLPTKKAHITTRNFPDAVDEIRKKLQIKEGGEMYLFATTLLDEQKVILVCRRL